MMDERHKKSVSVSVSASFAHFNIWNEMKTFHPVRAFKVNIKVNLSFPSSSLLLSPPLSSVSSRLRPPPVHIPKSCFLFVRSSDISWFIHIKDDVYLFLLPFVENGLHLVHVCFCSSQTSLIKWHILPIGPHRKWKPTGTPSQRL